MAIRTNRGAGRGSVSGDLRPAGRRPAGWSGSCRLQRVDRPGRTTAGQYYESPVCPYRGHLTSLLVPESPVDQWLYAPRGCRVSIHGDRLARFARRESPSLAAYRKDKQCQIRETAQSSPPMARRPRLARTRRRSWPMASCLPPGRFRSIPETMKLVEGDITAQTERVMENLSAVLAAAGSSFERVVKTTCFLSDLDNFACRSMPSMAATLASRTRPPFHGPGCAKLRSARWSRWSAIALV